MAPAVALITCWYHPYYQSSPARRRLRDGNNPVIKYYALAANFPAFSTKAKKVLLLLCVFLVDIWLQLRRGDADLCRGGGFKRPAAVSAS